MLISGLLSSCAQILLKKSSQQKRAHIIYEFLNLKVIVAYLIIFACMLLVIVAFKSLSYKLGTILESISYLYILLLSRIFLNEKITRKKLLGNFLIIFGILVFNLKF
ncbi:MAG: EamA family transporter [Deltaproteobacteria bacterium]|nr:EamA family transporter [Deltaproteobacteria bacterium]